MNEQFSIVTSKHLTVTEDTETLFPNHFIVCHLRSRTRVTWSKTHHKRLSDNHHAPPQLDYFSGLDSEFNLPSAVQKYIFDFILQLFRKPVKECLYVCFVTISITQCKSLIYQIELTVTQLLFNKVRHVRTPILSWATR